MNNFIFQNPTKLIFGKGQIARLSKELPKDSKILVTFGGGSVKKNGVYDQVIAALEEQIGNSGADYVELTRLLGEKEKADAELFDLMEQWEQAQEAL